MEASSVVSSSTSATSKPINHRRRIPWPGGPSVKQSWSLPDSIIHNMAKNPSSVKCYQKLIDSCKLFFEKMPLLIVKKIEICEDDVSCIICSNTRKSCFNQKCCVKVDIGKLSSKLWITKEADAVEADKTFIEMILPKVYRCEASFLKLFNQIVTIDSFKFLTSSVKTLYLYHNSIEHEDGKPVMLEEILKSLPNVEHLYLVFKDGDSMVNASTMTNILKLDSLCKHKHLDLDECPEVLATADLSTFFKKYANMAICLHFTANISEAYKNQLDYIIDEIIASKVRHHIITYDGQDEKKLNILQSHY